MQTKTSMGYRKQNNVYVTLIDYWNPIEQGIK